MTAALPQMTGAVSERTVSVLVVDDTPTLRMLTKLTLEGSGFEVVGEAGDGLAALNLAKQLRPDLVLLDLAMPVMDGLEALPLLLQAVPATKVVIVSGFDRKAMESQVIEAGAHAYLQKGTAPIDTLRTLRALFPAAQAPAVPAPRAEAEPAPAPPAASSAEVQELEEELEELLYVVSHDLAEPVHVIKGFAERLARRAHSDEEAEFCEFITDAADRMQLLLDDLLDYARAGRGEVPVELLDLRRLVDNVLSGHGSTIASTGARITTGDLPRDVVASRLVLTQVLHNLVGNSLKFVTPGATPQVRLEGEVRGGVLQLRVSDRGIGIDPSQYDRIFQPFKRLHSRDRYPGSGIGLAICRRLVQRCGGRLWVESDESGSTFYVEVPS